jgi:hypothetical protein
LRALRPGLFDSAVWLMTFYEAVDILFLSYHFSHLKYQTKILKKAKFILFFKKAYARLRLNAGVVNGACYFHSQPERWGGKDHYRHQSFGISGRGGEKVSLGGL